MTFCIRIQKSRALNPIFDFGRCKREELHLKNALTALTAVGMDQAETDRNKSHSMCSLTKIMFVGEDVTITLS